MKKEIYDKLSLEDKKIYLKSHREFNRLYSELHYLNERIDMLKRFFGDNLERAGEIKKIEELKDVGEDYIINIANKSKKRKAEVELEIKEKEKNMKKIESDLSYKYGALKENYFNY